MRIAQVAPLYESVPPKLYGSPERVVSYLTEQLVADGHEVTLYASGDSITSARLEPVSPHALRRNGSCEEPLAHHYVMLEKLIRDRRNFDIIHFHTDFMAFPVARHLALPHVTTLHGRLDRPDLSMLYQEFSDSPVVSVSNSQRAPLPNARWVGTVLHGVPPDLFHFAEPRKGYLAFLGRVSPEKGLDRAIEIATRLETPLRVAAKVDRADRDHYLRNIQPLLQNPFVEFIGEIADSEKDEFLGGARALLLPIDRPQPFGLGLIEAMACGTPVVAFNRGSVSEIIVHGENGFLVESVDQAIAAVKRLPDISRRRCRDLFEEGFTSGRMTKDYLAIYDSLTDGTRRIAERAPREESRESRIPNKLPSAVSASSA
jgi:glycosyltransferase involved in cell wall biosynthesis